MKGTKEIKTNKGITLIALVITIIVMLILVGVSISMSVNGGLFDKAGEAVAKTNNALLAEQQLAEGGITIGDKYYPSIDGYVKGPTAENLFGVWVFNDEITLLGAFRQEVNFVSEGVQFSHMRGEIINEGYSDSNLMYRRNSRYYNLP